jgi:transcriptional repressor NrdR
MAELGRDGSMTRPASSQSGTPLCCPFCQSTDGAFVVDSRVGREGSFVRRRRQCVRCGKRYTTYEYVEEVARVTKSGGRQEPFEPGKLASSIRAALSKGSPVHRDIDEFVAGVQADVAGSAAVEPMTTAAIRERIFGWLGARDPLAAIRYASAVHAFALRDFLALPIGTERKAPRSMPGRGR